MISKNVKSFIEKCRKVHGRTYDYSLVKYCGSHIKVKILCDQHGIFEQSPSNHLAGRGCKQCSRDNLSLKFREDEISFVRKANLVHNFKYDYTNVKYTGSFDKIKLICPRHGLFEKTPSNHLRGQGCTSAEFMRAAKRPRMERIVRFHWCRSEEDDEWLTLIRDS